MTSTTLEPVAQSAEQMPVAWSASSAFGPFHDVASEPTAITRQVLAWKEEIEACAFIAGQVVDTEMVPTSYWPLPRGVKNVRDCINQNPRIPQPNENEEAYAYRRRIALATTTGVVNASAGLGIHWRTGLTGIDYVRGRQSMRAQLMAALFRRAGHRYRIVEESAQACILAVQLRGEAEESRVEFTMAEALGAGYVFGKGADQGKNRGNDLYNTIPAWMLLQRGLSRMVKSRAPEVTMGIDCVEDRLDIPADDITVTVASTPDRVAAALEARPEAPPAAAEAPPAPAPAPAEAPPPQRPAGRALGNRGWALLQGRFNEIGITGKGMQEERRAVIAHMIRRQVKSAADLTEEEGRWLLDNLAGIAGHRLCAAVLKRDDLLPVEDRQPAPEPTPAPAPATPAAPPATSEDLPDPTAGGDPWADADVQDPPAGWEGQQ